MRLLVAQHPAGETTHTISFGDAAGDFQEVHGFQGHTENGAWLEFEPEPSNSDPDPDPNLDPNLPRGLAWVRSNRMFISALTVSTGPPTAAQVSEYYDEFNATAAHMWNDGITNQLPGWQSAAHPSGRWLSWVENHGTAFNGESSGVSPQTRLGGSDIRSGMSPA